QSGHLSICIVSIEKLHRKVPEEASLGNQRLLADHHEPIYVGIEPLQRIRVLTLRGFPEPFVADLPVVIQENPTKIFLAFEIMKETALRDAGPLAYLIN